jgi:dienelactone hydrolase
MADQVRRQFLLGTAAVCLATRALAPRNGNPIATAFAGEGQARRRREVPRHVLGDMPARSQPNLKILDSVKLDAGWRHKVEYLAEPADPLFDAPVDMIRAYLFVPDHSNDEVLPALVAIHQDGPQSHIGKSEPAGLTGDKNQYYGLELFQRGYVVLCPDRFGHAERRRTSPNDISSIDPNRDDELLNHRVGQLLLRGRSMIGKEVFDLMVATDVLASLGYVDKDRVGAIGHSAGGNALIYFMFADPRIRVGVSSCGLFDMLKFFSEAAPKKRLAAIALPGLAKVGDSADYLALIAPRPVLLTRGLWEWGKEGQQERYSRAHVQETRDMETKARRNYARLGASANLQAVYFDEAGGNHDFPPTVRHEAYQWIDRHLNRPA